LRFGRIARRSRLRLAGLGWLRWLWVAATEHEMFSSYKVGSV